MKDDIFVRRLRESAGEFRYIAEKLETILFEIESLGKNPSDYVSTMKFLSTFADALGDYLDRITTPYRREDLCG